MLLSNLRSKLSSGSALNGREALSLWLMGATASTDPVTALQQHLSPGISSLFILKSPSARPPVLQGNPGMDRSTYL